MRRTALLVSMLCFCLGCSTNQNRPPRREKMHPDKKLTPEYTHAKSPVRVDVGKRLAFRLKSNPTTGYKWQLAKDLDESVVKLIDTKYEPPKRMMPGAGGEEIWTFEAVSKGRTTIKLKYCRPWEKNIMPAKKMTFTIVVE